jgi:hypothetical protein
MVSRALRAISKAMCGWLRPCTLGGFLLLGQKKAMKKRVNLCMEKQVSNVEVKRLLEWATIFVLVFEVVLAAIFPTNFAELSPWLGSITKAVAEIVPSIDQVTRLSDFPEATKVVFLSAWLLGFLLAVIYSYGFLRLVSPVDIIRYQRYRVVLTLAISVFMPTMLWGFAFLMGSEPIRTGGIGVVDSITRFASHSRVGLSVIGWLVAVGVAGASALMVLWFRVLPKLFGPGK